MFLGYLYRIQCLCFRFCATRWIDDETVVAKTMLTRSNIIKLTSHLESQSKSKRPDNKSYRTP